jgi:hypothetical protein
MKPILALLMFATLATCAPQPIAAWIAAAN